jgi:5-hydroxyisourate hydrolase
MSPITTHVLDIARGGPAAGIVVVVEKHIHEEGWAELARGTTNADGRITDLLSPEPGLESGVYRLRFGTGTYFASHGLRGFYPEVHVLVNLDDSAAHYHIPLLLSPYGYSTYRGT